MHDAAPLRAFLARVPAVSVISAGEENELWWVKLAIDIDHALAWRVVQELGHVLNYLSMNERLPTVFMPVSPPPYANGGPREFLSWAIESTDAEFTPATCAEWLQGRLPAPIDDLGKWSLDDE